MTTTEQIPSIPAAVPDLTDQVATALEALAAQTENVQAARLEFYSRVLRAVGQSASAPSVDLQEFVGVVWRNVEQLAEEANPSMSPPCLVEGITNQMNALCDIYCSFDVRN